MKCLIISLVYIDRSLQTLFLTLKTAFQTCHSRVLCLGSASGSGRLGKSGTEQLQTFEDHSDIQDIEISSICRQFQPSKPSYSIPENAMADRIFIYLISFVSLLPLVLSTPILGWEECVCQPLEPETSSNSSLASCEIVAREIEQWRALAFHSPCLADLFGDTEHRLHLNRYNDRPRHTHKVENVRHGHGHVRIAFGTFFNRGTPVGCTHKSSRSCSPRDIPMD